ncbi:MAG: lamin tail domain-containing protein [Woeseiaceae bacterium]
MPAYFARLCSVLFLLVGFTSLASAQVFINEIHYDNDGGDTGEAIEIAGPAGVDVTGWSVVLYNGNGGTTYGTTPLSGAFVNQQGGFGTMLLTYPTNGIQNGAPDGLALVDSSNAVVQFLSYEGVITATNGPATGLTSVDIGVSEPGNTPVGQSLQLVDDLTNPGMYVWADPQESTFCAVNIGQTFGDGTMGPDDPCASPGGDPSDITLVINEIDYDQPSSDFAEFLELKNVGTSDVDLNGVSVQLINGSNNTVYNTINLPAETLGAGEYFVICTNRANTPRCNIDSISSIQNGAPDGAVIMFDGFLIDAVSYEGDLAAPNVEGSGVGLVDPGTFGSDFLGISRYPDGIDTQQNNVDLSTRCATPGRANAMEAEDCPDPVPPLVINEVLADPAGRESIDLEGDANNDGVRDSSEDEFVEIVNTSDGPLDLSGWTLADGFSVRHTFPANSVVPSQCAIVIFGGGVPIGEFGKTIVQTASGGSLGLNNSGDTVTLNNGVEDIVSLAYGSAGGDNQSLTRDPDVFGVEPLTKHSVAAGSGGSLFSPGTRVDGAQFDGCPKIPVGTFEIYDIQGSGDASPYEDLAVISEGNIVTALAVNGFTMQTPTSRTDMNVDTSDGIFVFTGGAPTVAVGDLVDVTGEIDEFFGLTQFTNLQDLTILSSAMDLPTPVTFDAATPSPDATTPSCAIEFECYESMLVEVANGTVTGPNQRFNTDPVAEVHITAASSRTFREKGIEGPGLPGLPDWDDNPEVFELDPDRVGLPNQIIPAGSSFSATGVIGFDFGGYELWPTSLTVHEADLPRAVRHKRWSETTVGSLNLFRLFDDIDDPEGMNVFGEPTNDTVVSSDEYQRRLSKFAHYIVESMRSPDIIGVQEVESQKVLDDLAAAVNALHPWAYYEAHVIEGNDIGTIDVGFLVRKWRVWFVRIEQLGADETYVNPEDGELDILHDRPPLLLKGWAGFLPINVMVVHNRSLNGISTERVQVKRLEQAQSIAQKAQDIQSSGSRYRPANLVVVGDFNAFEFTDGYVDALGHIRGDFDPSESVLSGTDLVEPDLLNQLMSLPEEERYSFIFRGNAQTLDHALTSSSLDYRVRGLQYARGNADAAVDLINDDTTVLRSSDHDGLVLYIYKYWIRRHRHH